MLRKRGLTAIIGAATVTRPRRGGRVVECAGFENRSARKGSGSSNLPLSAKSPFGRTTYGPANSRRLAGLVVFGIGGRGAIRGGAARCGETNDDLTLCRVSGGRDLGW